MIEVLNTQPMPAAADAPVVLMVSGGSDSTAMLVRAARDEIDLQDGRGPRRLPGHALHVLHVNHCLRGPDADADERFVVDLCAELGVDCRTARVDVPGAVASGGGNVEEVARLMRYAAAWDLVLDLAEEKRCDPRAIRVLVAHTADDRAETFLMRAVTGAGSGGLSGMRRTHGLVVRPVLDRTRAELRRYLDEQGVAWCEDATNAEDAALRSYIRNRVVPPIAARCPDYASVLSRGLDVLADEDDLLDRLARDAYGRVCAASAVSRAAGAAVLDAGRLCALDPALARRVVRIALGDLLGADGFERARFERAHVEAVLSLARARCGSATLPLDVDARVARGAVVLTYGARRPPADAALPVPGSATWGGWTLEALLVDVPDGVDPVSAAAALSSERSALGLVEGRDFAIADARVAAGGALLAGSPRDGERMAPFGLGAEKAVRDVLADAGVPGSLRRWSPIVRSAAGEVVWAVGARLDARAAWRASTGRLLVLNACSASRGE